MPTFDITAPDGTHYEVTGPDGATEQQALQQVMAQHAQPAQPSGPQPSFMDRLAGSPVGRFAHDAIGGMIGGALHGPLSAGAAVANAIPGNGATMAGTPLPQQAPLDPNDVFGIENTYQGALSRNRNTPGYLDARTMADKAIAARGGSGFQDQMTAPFLPSIAGTVGLAGGLDSSNAMADAQEASQGSYAAAHPLLSMGANVLGSVLTGAPEGTAAKLPVYAGDNPTLTRAINPNAMGPLPVRPSSVPVSPGVGYVRNLVASSGKTPADLSAFDTGGKPFTSAEAIGKPGEVAVGALARREGSTAGDLLAQISGRQDDAPGRVLEDYASASGIDPAAARGDIQALVKNGRAAAKPLYDDALAGGSTAPLQDQLRSALTSATGAKGQIAKQLKAIENNNPGALASRGAAGAETRAKYMDLHQQLQQAESDRVATLEMFQKSANDAASNAPGAVWSPRLQQFLNDPILKRGLGRGLELERLDALAEGKPFNPTELGVTGTDEAGHPIIGNVPNMRVLDAGKKGLDAILREEYSNPHTGRVMLTDPRAAAIDQVRRAYIGELDNLNPRYKAARAMAGDYLSSQDAFQRGGKMLLDGNLPVSDFAQHLTRLDTGDKQAFLGGIGNDLYNLAQNGKLAPKVFDRPIIRQKLEIALGKDQAQKFVTALQNENRMAGFARTRVPGAGSPSAEYLEAIRQQDAGHASNLLPEAMDFLSQVKSHGPVKGAFSYGAGKAQDAVAAYATRGMPIAARDEAGRLLMLPPQQLGSQLAKLPTLPVKGPMRVPPQLLPLLGLPVRSGQ